MQKRMRTIQIGIAAGALWLGLSAATQAQQNGNVAAAGMSPREQSAADALVEQANQDRARHHLPSLRQEPMLTRAAWNHDQIMVRSGTLSHQLPGEPDLIARVQQAGVHCSTVDENVAEGPTVNRINDEWMHSPMHRANLLDPRVNSIGVAVIQHNGDLYAVQDFAREMSAMTPEQQEHQVASLLRSKGLAVENDDRAARAYCGGSPGSAAPRPKLIMRYSTTDLSRLPQQVEQGIHSGSFHRAAVGACSPANQNGFSAYQTVILLY